MLLFNLSCKQTGEQNFHKSPLFIRSCLCYKKTNTFSRKRNIYHSFYESNFWGFHEISKNIVKRDQVLHLFDSISLWCYLSQPLSLLLLLFHFFFCIPIPYLPSNRHNCLAGNKPKIVSILRIKRLSCLLQTNPKHKPPFRTYFQSCGPRRTIIFRLHYFKEGSFFFFVLLFHIMWRGVDCDCRRGCLKCSMRSASGQQRFQQGWR